MICQECGKKLTNEEDCYGHDCEVVSMKQYIVRWVDRNSLVVKANSEKEAIEKVKEMYDDDEIKPDVYDGSEYEAEETEVE